MLILVMALYLIGFVVVAIAHGNGLLHYYYFDILGMIIAGTGFIVVVFRLQKGGAMPYFNMPKRNKPLFEFMYRIGLKRPVYGKRLPGTGFSQIKKHGLIQEIGRQPAPGSVYHHGDHAVQFALQDIGHTPNPLFAGFLPFLDELGFDTIGDVKRVLNGYDPHLMAKVWHNLNEFEENEPKNSAELLVKRLQTLPEKEMKKYPKFSDSKDKKKGIYTEVDGLLKKMKNKNTKR